MQNVYFLNKKDFYEKLLEFNFKSFIYSNEVNLQRISNAGNKRTLLVNGTLYIENEEE
ncbi:hypothetical protein [Klebsiella phage 05F01]|nr:hypothetical protein [Klebsiella phage 05F01]